MTFFFVKDSRRKYRYFSSEPARPVDVKFSRSKEVWEMAKKKLTILPKRTLRMEQAFEKAWKLKGNALRILYGSETDEAKIRFRFSFFLQKQRTRHIIVLAAEAVVLPFTAVTAILPGPNIIFYALALIMITQWFALKGIGRTIRAEHEFVPDESLADWERAVDSGDRERRDELIGAIEKRHAVHGLGEVLG